MRGVMLVAALALGACAPPPLERAGPPAATVRGVGCGVTGRPGQAALAALTLAARRAVADIRAAQTPRERIEALIAAEAAVDALSLFLGWKGSGHGRP